MKADLPTLRALDRLLDEALDVPDADRDAWIARLAGDDARHAPLLRELLGSEARARTLDWLDRPVPFGPDASDAGSAPREAGFATGDLVGPWRLVALLGAGGMGEVWRASRADGRFAREVALKLPHGGTRVRGIAERYARERDILASLAHPNIARFYDAGVDDGGQPWLAMELVAG